MVTVSLRQWWEDVKSCHDPGALARRAHLSRVVAAWPAGFPRTVLDVGCGRGRNCFLLAALRPAAAIVGIDVDLAALREARAAARRRRVANVRFVGGDTAALPPEGRFDVVMFIDVLEHIGDDVAALARAAALLREGGRLVIHVPSLDQRRHFGVGRGDAAFAGGEDYGHVRDGYDAGALAAMVAAAGLDVQAAIPTVATATGTLADLDYAWARRGWHAGRVLTYGLARAAVSFESARPPRRGRGVFLVAGKPADERGSRPRRETYAAVPCPATAARS